MEEDDVLCRFGTPLEPLVEDEIPSKKPILIEDQIVTDENGRRRFHGAFTGGFSAGFWNTVGSLEGWTPKEFKSSRDEKNKIPVQKPADFMDDEDFGEFGIAPQRIQTTADFTSKNNSKDLKRKQNQKTDGPIPGVPVLHQLLEPSKENIAIRLLKKMGWKEGQGIGARQTKREKKLTNKQNFKEQYILKKYGCDTGPISKPTNSECSSDESELSDTDEITFAPDDFEPYVCVAKDNCFGLAYSGLSRDPVLKQHINLFGPLEVLSKNKEKLSIRGKGFGVGALEEEDEDIYHHDDMSNYDFSLEKANKIIKPKVKPQDTHIIEGFSTVNESSFYAKKIFIVKFPQNYVPRNWLVRRTRFEPLDETRSAILKQQDEMKTKGLGRHDITAKERGEILEGTSKITLESRTKPVFEEAKGSKKRETYLEKINKKYKNEEKKKEDVLDMLAARFDSFVKSEVVQEDATILKKDGLSEEIKMENEKLKIEANKITKNLESTMPSTFKPFLADSAKEERYEKFISMTFSTEEEVTEFLNVIQPTTMSNWEKRMERKEFEQAKKIYKPLKGIMSDRFVTETEANTEREKQKIDPDRKGKTVRTKTVWHPTSILCKRFNIAEPFANLIKEEQTKVKKPKLSVFDYLESSVNKKETFVTPVIIPNCDFVPNTDIGKTDSPKRLSAKDLFAKEVNSVGAESSEPTAEKQDVLEPEVKTDKVSEKTAITKTSKPKDGKETKDVPKTELEEKIEQLKNKHPSEKKDLYKKVFESSSESEEEISDTINKSEKNGENKVNRTDSDAKSKDLLVSLNKPASEINILRNDSPPRGIFAAFFDKNLETHKFKPKQEREKESLETVDSTNVYGPQIPMNIAPLSNNTDLSTANSQPLQQKSDIDSKLEKLLVKHKKNTKIVEEWVEVTELNKKVKKDKKDKKKKKKKEKSKHRSRSSSTSSNSSSTDSSLESSHRTKKKSKKNKKSKKHKK